MFTFLRHRKGSSPIHKKEISPQTKQSNWEEKLSSYAIMLEVDVFKFLFHVYQYNLMVYKSKENFLPNEDAHKSILKY